MLAIARRMLIAVARADKPVHATATAARVTVTVAPTLLALAHAPARGRHSGAAKYD